jgi:type I restriction enzyme S subunit
LLAKTTGSVFPNLSSSDLRKFAVLIPTEPIIEKYCSTIQPLIKKLWINIHQASTFASVRDALLPKLLSGEIRVKDAEKVVETVI